MFKLSTFKHKKKKLCMAKDLRYCKEQYVSGLVRDALVTVTVGVDFAVAYLSVVQPLGLKLTFN